jgi:hypothetical protein
MEEGENALKFLLEKYLELIGEMIKAYAEGNYVFGTILLIIVGLPLLVLIIISFAGQINSQKVDKSKKPPPIFSDIDYQNAVNKVVIPPFDPEAYEHQNSLDSSDAEQHSDNGQQPINRVF